MDVAVEDHEIHMAWIMRQTLEAPTDIANRLAMAEATIENLRTENQVLRSSKASL